MKRCVSCGRNTNEFAEFPNPVGDKKIVRCIQCRKNKNEYTVDGFNGP